MPKTISYVIAGTALVATATAPALAEMANRLFDITARWAGMLDTSSNRAGFPWGEHLVEVTKPDGRKRAIFFRGTTPYGADSAQADGSAGWDFTTSHDGDEVTVRFGPETYVIVDALIEGG